MAIDDIEATHDAVVINPGTHVPAEEVDSERHVVVEGVAESNVGGVLLAFA